MEFDAPLFKALGEGRLSISIRLKSQPIESKIQGLLAPKFSCDLFDCILTPFEDPSSNIDNNNLVSGSENANAPDSGIVGNEVETGASSNINGDGGEETSSLHEMRGLAWMTMHSTGSIKYQLR